MNVNLTKEDIYNLLSSLKPPLEELIKLGEKDLIYDNGSYGVWYWNWSNLSYLSEQELWDLYNYLKLWK